MDTVISNFLRTFVVNTVFANPPPENCPPPQKLKPCPNKSKSSEFEKPPSDAHVSGSTKPSQQQAGAKPCHKSPPGSPRGDFGKSGLSDVEKSGLSDFEKSGARDLGKSGASDLGKSGASDLGQSGAGDPGKTGSGNVGKTGAGNLGKSGVANLGKTAAGSLGKSGAGDLGKTAASDLGKTGAGNLGKAGAGVTGSRTGTSGQSELADQNEYGLPVGATNPGLLRHIHNAARYRLPQCFEGADVTVKQRSENNWILGHSMMFSSVSPGGYKLLLSYMNKEKPTGLPYFVMESAPGGQMSCEVRVAPTYRTRATVMAQVAETEFRSFESIIDFFFNNSTASVIAVNREFIAVHFLQAISEKLSVGAEVVSRGQYTEMSSASGAARWATDDFAVSGTLGNRGLDLCLARAVRPFLTVAALLEVGFAIRRAVATLAYEWRGEDWTFRGSADSDGLIGATLQRALGGQRAHLACAISALYNHPNDKFREINLPERFCEWTQSQSQKAQV